MEQFNVAYSHKNIPIPDQHQYQMILLEKIESLITRMRWKAFHYLNATPPNQDEKYGFHTNTHPPFIKQMSGFESDLIGIIKTLKFRKVNNALMNNLNNDLRSIFETTEVITKADKSGNLYKMSPRKYKQMLHNEVTKFYKKATSDIELQINKEARDLASSNKLANRIEKFTKKEAFITLKDHKRDFANNPSCRLLNPTKTNMGQISKIMLQDICETLRIALRVNQWRSTSDCIKWFNNTNIHQRCTFIKYDIRDFYPSINKKNFAQSIPTSKAIHTHSRR